MFSLLDIVNSYLGYFTTNTRTKGKIYTVVAMAGVWYILYLSLRFFQNGRWLRGSLLVAVFLVLLYFSILNVFYFFTTKAMKWDVSRLLAKVLGTTIPVAGEATAAHPIIMPANGMYDRKDVLKAEVQFSDQQQQAIDNLAQQLEAMNMWAHDYHSLNKKGQRQIIAQDGCIHDNHPGTLLPYFDLQEMADGSLDIVAGLNQLQAQDIATITKIGLLPVRQAQKDYQLSLASVVITGGKSHVQGRRELVEVVKPHYVKVEVAYAQREKV
ncbi:DUF6681 family protein [Convivina praedatoris]|uniref:Uncharacterized protein n=1 Tax=Convivina praedatoris TaxID=2880963 RepID=A0ABN8HEX0_9LACO|nr:DUF6681 family protein [Convivina sp. LMG 32447]CAH1856970.1 hypothetical protein R077815_01514 [Convivina sp. LMG 32447]CAH1857242.1 hypothetical protein R078138_01546 [Convivina sp. LMG 32447]CAH1857443.1 hypothetical protein LMG032447_01546 [Convivina sp. LMG 32447]